MTRAAQRPRKDHTSHGRLTPGRVPKASALLRGAVWPCHWEIASSCLAASLQSGHCQCDPDTHPRGGTDCWLPVPCETKGQVTFCPVVVLAVLCSEPTVRLLLQDSPWRNRQRPRPRTSLHPSTPIVAHTAGAQPASQEAQVPALCQLSLQLGGTQRRTSRRGGQSLGGRGICATKSHLEGAAESWEACPGMLFPDTSPTLEAGLAAEGAGTRCHSHPEPHPPWQGVPEAEELERDTGSLGRARDTRLEMEGDHPKDTWGLWWGKGAAGQKRCLPSGHFRKYCQPASCGA